jgi:hypothetical protein
MDSISVPSLLASEGVAANSFSMCFGEDGHGRINFGDTGSSDQQETPLNIYKQKYVPTHHICISYKTPLNIYKQKYVPTRHICISYKQGTVHQPHLDIPSSAVHITT